MVRCDADITHRREDIEENKKWNKNQQYLKDFLSLILRRRFSLKRFQVEWVCIGTSNSHNNQHNRTNWLKKGN